MIGSTMSKRRGVGMTPRNGSTHHNNNHSCKHNKMLVRMTLAFLVGSVLGHIHGRCYCSNTTATCISTLSIPSSLSKNASSSSSSNNSSNSNSFCMEKEQDGWHSIHVFYGDTDKHAMPVLEGIRSQIQLLQLKQPSHDGDDPKIISGTLPAATTKNALANIKTTDTTATTGSSTSNIMNSNNATELRTITTTTTATLDTEGRMWFAQAQQDQIVYHLLHEKKNGYFLDLAANDAFELSNTAGLERNARWNGLCMEPNPLYWYNLTYYRKCHVVAAVVGSGLHRMEQVHFRYNAGDHSGIVGDQFDNGKRWKKNSVLQWTVPLVEVLQYLQVPRTIDYLSLDVEGAEEYILQNFPFEQYSISILTVERPKESLRTLLEQHGYQYLKRLTMWGESLWAHESVMKQLNLQVLDKFGPQKRRKKGKEKQ